MSDEYGIETNRLAGSADFRLSHVIKRLFSQVSTPSKRFIRQTLVTPEPFYRGDDLIERSHFGYHLVGSCLFRPTVIR